MASQVLLFLCFSPTFSDSQEPPYFFRPQFGTVTVCIYILLAKANYMTKPKISEAGNHTLPVPVLCKATWQRQKGSEGLGTKIQPTYVKSQNTQASHSTLHLGGPESSRLVQSSFNVLQSGLSPISCLVHVPGTP